MDPEVAFNRGSSASGAEPDWPSERGLGREGPRGLPHQAGFQSTHFQATEGHSSLVAVELFLAGKQLLTVCV